MPDDQDRTEDLPIEDHPTERIERPGEQDDEITAPPPSAEPTEALRPPPPPADAFDDRDEPAPSEPEPEPEPETEREVAPGAAPVAASSAANDDEPPAVHEDPDPTQALPEVEDITFTPRETPAAVISVTPDREPAPEEPEEVQQFPAPQRPRAPIGPTTMKRSRFLTLAAAAEALLPRGGPVEQSADDVGVAERIDRAVASFDPAARRAFERAIGVLGWTTVFSRALRPLGKLPVAARQAALERARRSRLPFRRAAAELVCSVCANQWAAHPDVEGALGFTYACATQEAPRAAEPLEVLGYPRIGIDHIETCDVVVVGSGAGGAVVAKELAEVGLSVIVLEEGAAFDRSDFTGPPLERQRRLYRRNGMLAVSGSPGMPLSLGMGVGGSTLVSAGSAMRAPAKVLGRWADEGLEMIDAVSLRPFFERVEKIQRVQPVPDALVGANARVFASGSEKLGHHGLVAHRMIDGCRGCGVCSWGCPSDAKLSTHLTYLPRAQRAGASIYAGTRVERIVIEEGRATGVVATLLDPGSREPKAKLEVRAKMVVLAAGAIHTPTLLARNALGNRSGLLGKNLHLGPVTTVGAFFDEPIHAWRGTLQSFTVDDWHDSHGVLVRSTAPVPSVSGGVLPGVGTRFKEMLGRFPYLATATVLTADAPSGRVIARANGEPLVLYRLGDTDAKRVVRGVIHAAEIFLAAGARGIVTNLPGVDHVIGASALRDIEEDAIKPGRLRLAAQHPGGTARMGVDPASAVTDQWGAVHGVEALFVADASLMPTSPAVDPQVTVMALATRTADHIARHASRWF